MTNPYFNLNNNNNNNVPFGYFNEENNVFSNKKQKQEASSQSHDPFLKPKPSNIITQNGYIPYSLEKPRPQQLPIDPKDLSKIIQESMPTFIPKVVVPIVNNSGQAQNSKEIVSQQIVNMADKESLLKHLNSRTPKIEIWARYIDILFEIFLKIYSGEQLSACEEMQLCAAKETNFISVSLDTSWNKAKKKYSHELWTSKLNELNHNLRSNTSLPPIRAMASEIYESITNFLLKTSPSPNNYKEICIYAPGIVVDTSILKFINIFLKQLEKIHDPLDTSVVLFRYLILRRDEKTLFTFELHPVSLGGFLNKKNGDILRKLFSLATVRELNQAFSAILKNKINEHSVYLHLAAEILLHLFKFDPKNEYVQTTLNLLKDMPKTEWDLVIEIISLVLPLIKNTIEFYNPELFPHFSLGHFTNYLSNLCVNFSDLYNNLVKQSLDVSPLLRFSTRSDKVFQESYQFLHEQKIVTLTLLIPEELELLQNSEKYSLPENYTVQNTFFSLGTREETNPFHKESVVDLSWVDENQDLKMITTDPKLEVTNIPPVEEIDKLYPEVSKSVMHVSEADQTITQNNPIAPITKEKPISQSQILKLFEDFQKRVLKSSVLTRKLCKLIVDKGWSFPFLDMTADSEELIRQLFLPFLKKKFFGDYSHLNPSFCKFNRAFPLDSSLLNKKSYPQDDLYTIRNYYSDDPYAIQKPSILKPASLEMREHSSFAFASLKLFELVECLRLDKKNEIVPIYKTVLIIAQNVNQAKFFVMTAYFNGFLEGFFEYVETPESIKLFQNKKIALDHGTDFSLSELQRIKEELNKNPELLKHFLILEYKKLPKLKKADEEEEVESDEKMNKTEEINKSDVREKEFGKPIKRKEKSSIESENESENVKSKESKKHKREVHYVGKQNTEYRPSGSFKDNVEDAVISGKRKIDKSEESSIFFIPPQKKSSSQNIIEANPWDSLKIFEKVVRKIQDQDALYKGIGKNEPLELYQAEETKLSDGFISYVGCLKDYQQRAVNQLIHSSRVLSWEMGTGKTFVYIGLLLEKLANGGKRFLITAPLNVVPQIAKNMRTQLELAQYAIVKDIATNSGLAHLKTHLNSYFTREFFEAFNVKKSKEPLSKSTLQAYCQCYKIGDEPESALWQILGNNQTRENLYSHCKIAAQENLNCLFSTEEGKKTFHLQIQALKNEIPHHLQNEKWMSLLKIENLEDFEKACDEIMNFQPNIRRSIHFGAIFFLLVRLSEMGAQKMLPILKWDMKSTERNLRILDFAAKDIIKISEPKEFKEVYLNSKSIIMIINHHGAINKISSDSLWDQVIVDEVQIFHTPGTQAANWLTPISERSPTLPVTGSLIENHFKEPWQIIRYLLAHTKSSFADESQISLLQKRLEIAEKILLNASKDDSEMIDEKLTDIIEISFYYFLQLSSSMQSLVLSAKMQDPEIKQAWGRIPDKISLPIKRILFPEAELAIRQLEDSNIDFFKKLNKMHKILVHHSLKDKNKKDALKELENLLKNPDKFFNESPLISALNSEEAGLISEVINKGENSVIVVDRLIVAHEIQAYLNSIYKKTPQGDLILDENKKPIPLVKSWIFSGETPDDERQEIIDQFTSETPYYNSKVVILMEKAGGTGTNLQGPKTRRVYKLTNGFNPSEQAEDRIRRVTTPVNEIFVMTFFFGTLIEKHRHAILENKRLWESFLFEKNSLTKKFGIWLKILETDILKTILNQSSTNQEAEDQREEVGKILTSAIFDKFTEDYLKENYERFFSSAKKNSCNNNVSSIEEIISAVKFSQPQAKISIPTPNPIVPASQISKQERLNRNNIWLIPVKNKEEGLKIGIAARKAVDPNSQNFVKTLLKPDSTVEQKQNANNSLLAWTDHHVPQTQSFTKIIYYRDEKTSDLISMGIVPTGDKVRLFVENQKWYLILLK